VRITHLAGIIPIAGQEDNFKLPWHDCLMPISSNYLAVERAAVECAYAGCETIWIVCNVDMEPLIRYRLGDYIYDPVWMGRNDYGKNKKNDKKEIPIFYVPIHPNDRDKRDCLSWSILHGAVTAYHIGAQISKWVSPQRYYTAFPYSVYNPSIVRQHRDDISNKNGFVLSYENQTVRDGKFLGFTFDEKDYFQFRDEIKKGVGEYYSHDGPGFPKKRRPIEERWSARHFSLSDVFSVMNTDEKKVINVDWYYNIDNWENYCYYLSSEERTTITRPSEKILSPREFNPIGVDTEDNS